MFDDNSRMTGQGVSNQRTPTYDLRDNDLKVSLLVGASLMIATIALMLVIADTALGAALSVVFSIPFVGVILFGVLLTAGRYIGLKGFKENNQSLMAVGSALLVGLYGWFGGGILHPYDPALYQLALGITGFITIGISLVAATYVYTTDKNLQHWSKYANYAFFGVLGMSFVGSIFPPAILLAFALALFGFIATLVHEMWMTANHKRSAKANGFALYIAFAGVFVHILQIVIQILAEQ